MGWSAWVDIAINVTQELTMLVWINKSKSSTQIDIQTINYSVLSVEKKEKKTSYIKKEV